jgi:hypothetical protein
MNGTGFKNMSNVRLLYYQSQSFRFYYQTLRSWGNRLWVWEEDGTGSGLCPLVGFISIISVELLVSATREVGRVYRNRLWGRRWLELA